MFYPPEMIDRQLGRVFDEIHTKKLLSEQDSEKQIQNLSHVMTELNIIHPFREGNGRSIRELIRCMGLEYGLRLNWGNTDRDTLIDAAAQDLAAHKDEIEHFIEEGPRGDIVEKATQQREERRKRLARAAVREHQRRQNEIGRVMNNDKKER